MMPNKVKWICLDCGQSKTAIEMATQTPDLTAETGESVGSCRKCRSMTQVPCVSPHPDVKGLWCELPEQHYGVHMVTKEGEDVDCWFRNGEHPDATDDSYRIPVTAWNSHPERHASMNDIIDNYQTKDAQE